MTLECNDFRAIVVNRAVSFTSDNQKESFI